MPLADRELRRFSIRLEINEPVRGKNLADHPEIRERAKVKTKKPVIILTNESMIEGESRRMTETGIFLACKESLPKNETYTMAIRVSQKESVIVKGELVWSNLDSLRLGSPLSDVGMCFIKILEEDRHLFNHRVIERLKV
jgi:hypothetical protein